MGKYQFILQNCSSSLPSKFLSSPWMGKIKRVAAAGFYIPLAPPLTQKNFSHSYKVFCATYTRTAGFCSWQILHFVYLTAHKIRLFCCH